MPLAIPHPDDEPTRHRILRVSAGLFRQSGYPAVSMRRIADACGMTAGSIYHHFPSKDDIVAAVLNLGTDAVGEAVSAAISDTTNEPAALRIRRAIHAHLRALHEHSDFTSANVRIFGQLPDPVRTRNLESRRRYEKLWDRFLSDLKIRGGIRTDMPVEAMRLLLIGALNATLEWFDPHKGAVEALANRYSDLLLNGFLPSDRVST